MYDYFRILIPEKRDPDNPNAIGKWSSISQAYLTSQNWFLRQAIARENEAREKELAEVARSQAQLEARNAAEQSATVGRAGWRQ